MKGALVGMGLGQGAKELELSRTKATVGLRPYFLYQG